MREAETALEHFESVPRAGLDYQRNERWFLQTGRDYQKNEQTDYRQRLLV